MAASSAFPTARPLFPPVALSEDTAARFRDAAFDLLQRALAEYDEFAIVRQRRVDPARWRPLRSKEHLSVYREVKIESVAHPPPPLAATARRHGSSASSTSNEDSPAGPTRRQHQALAMAQTHAQTQAQVQVQTRLHARSYELPSDAFEDGAMPPAPPSLDGPAAASTLPRLLGVGSVVGALDDVMYGLAASDCAAVFLKAAYAHDDVLDADVLCKLEGPTPRDPFHFFGVKWLVKATAGAHRLVAPRDLVYLEATGVFERAGGERVGYQVMQSVQLPECGELFESHGVVRATTESCYLFTQQPNNACEVFVTSRVDPSGRVAESVALQSVANTLLHAGGVVHCGQGKKLAWRLGNDTHGGNVIMRMNEERPATPKACGICHKSFGLLKRRHVIECKLCFAAMCSRCSVAQTIHFVDASPRRRKRSKQVTSKDVELCKSCIAATTQTSALDIARAEVLSGRFGHVRSIKHKRRTTRDLELDTSLTTTTRKTQPRPARPLDASSASTAALSSSSVSVGSNGRPGGGSRNSLGNSHGPPVMLYQPPEGLDSRSSKSMSSNSTEPDVYDSEIEDDFDDVDEVLETANMTHVPSRGMFKNKLFMQMAELRSVAEDVYQYTRTNTAVHLTASSGSARAKRATGVEEP